LSTSNQNADETKSYDYDVALSFAGEQRDYVNRVAIALKASGIPVFYDGFEEDNLWGKNLYDYLRDIYATKAKYTVIFISRDYAKKLWTSHERKSAPPTKDPGLHFSDLSFSQSTLLGLLVLAGARAWCIATTDAAPAGATRLSRNLTIIPSEGEAFKKRQRQGIEALVGSRPELEALADTVGCQIQLHNPLLLAESTYDRFIKTDKRYILHVREKLQPFRTPLPTNPDSHLVLLSQEDGVVVAFAAPADYARDAFGIELHRDGRHQDAIYLKEMALLRNAKFVAIDAKTSRVLAIASIDSSLELNATRGSRNDVVQRIQASISTERRPVQLRAGTHVVETDEQSARRLEKAPVSCKLCRDSKEMVVSHNLRLYRVPCPDCNSHKNKSWSAFTSAFDDARRS